MKYNLGGISFWSMSRDDFNGDCGEPYALLKSIRQSMEEVISNSNKVSGENNGLIKCII